MQYALAAPVPYNAVGAMVDVMHRDGRIGDATALPHRRYAKVLQLQHTVIDMGKDFKPITTLAFKPIAGDVVRNLLCEFNTVAWQDQEWTAKSKRPRTDCYNY